MVCYPPSIEMIVLVICSVVIAPCTNCAAVHADRMMLSPEHSRTHMLVPVVRVDAVVSERGNAPSPTILLYRASTSVQRNFSTSVVTIVYSIDRVRRAQ